MKTRLYAIVLSLSVGVAVQAQVVSQASFLRAQQRADVVMPFRYLDQGVATPIEWGLDLAWLSEENVHRGVNYVGKDLIDIVRTSYTATESVEEGSLSAAQVAKVRERVNIIKKYLKSDVSLNINHDHGDDPAIDAWYNNSSAGSVERGKRWAKVIDLCIKKYAELGLTNIVSISPYNEPDLGWGQGYSNATRKSDFLNILKSLRQDYDGAYANVRMCGGNTLNDDYAYDWWSYLKDYLDEGNTHQLAGSFDNYASFFQKVREYGHHASADELHNTMEAMVGVEYGMQTGIWWGTCEHSRSQFMKATHHDNPGQRLAYAEHRNNWTAAAVYRQPDGRVQAFGGTSERQAAATSFGFYSMDRPVWYNGEPGREYVMALPGGTGYQQGQTNAETVVDVQSGTDIMPHIDGLYKVMNVNSGMLMGFGNTPTGWLSTTQKKNSNTAKFLQWLVQPLPVNSEGDFSYYTFMLNAGDSIQLDILNWNMEAGADVGGYRGGRGTNEQWFLEYAGEGAFYIRSRYSAKYLEVRGSSTLVSANISMGNFTGGKNQQWRFIPVGETPDLKAPAAPTELRATGQPFSVRLDWTASASTDVACYTVLRSDDGVDFYAIATQVKATSFADNEALPGKNYSYKIYAIDHSFNYSEQTEAVTGMCTGERDCVMQLPFDYTLNDTTQNGNHCALYGVQKWYKGRTGSSSLVLNGTDNFVQLPYMVANHDEMTIVCWVYWRGGNNWQRLWDFGTGTNQYMFFTPRSDSGMRFAIKNGGDEQQIRLTRSLTANKWTHVAVTLGAEGATLYIDGEVAGSNANINIRPSDFCPMFNYIGRSQFPADPNFKGYIDDFRIYSYALTNSEIAELIELANGINDTHADPNLNQTPAYDLSGRIAHKGTKGIVIEDGKKVLMR